jgi:hypothetical protein
MFVRLKHGPRAGEAVEMKFADAKVLLDDGRAERVNYDAPEAPRPVAAPAPKKKARKK